MRLRRFVQLTSLGVFFLLFFTTTYTLTGVLPHDLYLRSDPLAALLVLLTAPSAIGSFFLALVVAGSALVLGRLFCGYLCPMGSLLDAAGKVAGAPRGPSPPLPWARGVKYGILAASFPSALLGLSLLGWVDPLVLLTRATALLFDPWLQGAARLALEVFRPLADRLGWVDLANATVRPPVYWLTLPSGMLMGGILAVSLWRCRLWCRWICPLGALLGLLGRWALVRRRVTESCVDCGACEGSCPMGAVGEDPRSTRQGECILCKRCASVCPQEAIRFLPEGRLWDPGAAAGPILSRRGLLAAAGVGVFLGLTGRVDAGGVGPRDRLIRPPGALPEGEFLNRCLRCGLCLGACLTHTLQPSLWEAGLDGIWTPRLDLRLAPCEKQCNLCGRVCPSGAIRHLSMEERTHAKIGTAILRRERCLAWEQDKSCLVCDEICPYDAIEFREVEGKRRPFVTESRCNGCGYCEHKCPVEGESAIVVTRLGELRLSTGSYISEARQRGLVFEGPREADPSRPPPPQGKAPPGFILDP